MAIGHDSLLNLIRWHNRAFSVTAADRATQLASIGFDAAVWKTMAYLSAGANDHLVDEETRTQPEKLRDWLVHWRSRSVSLYPFSGTDAAAAISEETALRFLLTGAADTLRLSSKQSPIRYRQQLWPDGVYGGGHFGDHSASDVRGRLPAIGRCPSTTLKSTSSTARWSE